MSRRIQPLSVTLFFCDLLLVPVGFWSAVQLRSLLPLGRGGALAEDVVAVPAFLYLVAIFCWLLGLAAGGAYNPQLSLRWYNEAWRVGWGAALATMILAGVIYMTYRELSRLQFVYFFAATLLMLLGYRAALRVYYRAAGRARFGGRSRILIVGAGDLGERVSRAILDHSRWGFTLAGFVDDDPEKAGRKINGVPVLGSLRDLGAAVEKLEVDEVWSALPMRAHEKLNEMIVALEKAPVRIKVVPDYYSMALIRAEPEVLGGIPVIGLREPVIEGVPRLIKRAFDLLVGTLLLLLALPPMALIALLIRTGSPGPVLLRQSRVGENGRLFDMLKFRTMIAQAQSQEGIATQPDQAGQVVHKHKDDPRITRPGKLLRRYSLDELPQLINVLKGEMSLVGPRPEMPWLVDRYESWQRKRFAVPQGLTGWWQINGRSDRPMHLHTEDDLYYVYNYSIWLDIWILIRTPISVITGQGAF
jgi:exopolysaccharide biosynthesis polyprenyl glycosylphosphotransferase